MDESEKKRGGGRTCGTRIERRRAGARGTQGRAVKRNEQRWRIEKEGNKEMWSNGVTLREKRRIALKEGTGDKIRRRGKRAEGAGKVQGRDQQIRKVITVSARAAPHRHSLIASWRAVCRGERTFYVANVHRMKEERVKKPTNIEARGKR